MKLFVKRLGQKVEFGPVFNCPFARGFVGEQMWVCYILMLFGLTWEGVTFAAKTVTLELHNGCVPLRKNGRPRWPLTRWIAWNPLRDYLVNSWGLSNPGLVYCLLEWIKRVDPFAISLTSLKPTKEERLEETEKIAARLDDWRPSFQAPFAIIWNGGCPNDGAYRNMSAEDIIQEMIEIAKRLRPLDVPIIFNCSPVMPVSVIEGIHQHYDALWIGNTVPVGHSAIDWSRIFRGGISPLRRRGKSVDGGYSGPAALLLTLKLVQQVREKDIEIPIIASNGIRSGKDVFDLFMTGADAIGIGSIAFTRWWKMKEVIEAAYKTSTTRKFRKRKSLIGGC